MNVLEPAAVDLAGRIAVMLDAWMADLPADPDDWTARDCAIATCVNDLRDALEKGETK